MQNFDHNIGFWEKSQFFAENWQNSQKIVIITSTPALTKLPLDGLESCHQSKPFRKFLFVDPFRGVPAKRPSGVALEGPSTPEAMDDTTYCWCSLKSGLLLTRPFFIACGLASAWISYSTDWVSEPSYIVIYLDFYARDTFNTTAISMVEFFPAKVTA
jgi:hypothetical protein